MEEASWRANIHIAQSAWVAATVASSSGLEVHGGGDGMKILDGIWLIAAGFDSGDFGLHLGLFKIDGVGGLFGDSQIAERCLASETSPRPMSASMELVDLDRLSCRASGGHGPCPGGLC